MVDVRDQGPVVISEPAGLPGQHRGGDEHGRLGIPRRVVRLPGPVDEFDSAGQVSEEDLVALHQRGRILLPGVAQQDIHRAGRQPQVTQARQIRPGGAGKSQQRRVDSPGAGSRQHINRDAHIEDLQQFPVQVAGLAVGVRRRASRLVPPARIAGLLQQIHLPGHTAHPDGQADTPRHNHREPDFLRRVRHLSRLRQVRHLSRPRQDRHLSGPRRDSTRTRTPGHGW